MSLLICAELAVGGQLAPGWIEIEGARLVGTGPGPPPREPDETLEGVLTHGLFDLQVNGAGGHEVSGGAQALDAIDAIQLAHGVTSYLPTLVSPDCETAERVLPELAARVADPSSPVEGVHLEGPFLSRQHAGMHPHERLRSPADGVPDWVEHPAVRLVTLAPELPGALELVVRLRERGIAVALGHSGADAEVARAAIDAGASLVTHVFNAMPPLDHRAPGLLAVALVDPRVHVSVIADGIHVHPLALELVRAAKGSRAILVTDATPATEAQPGRYLMAGVPIERAGGAAYTERGVLAGSILTLDQAVRNWTAMTRATHAEALFAASQGPGLAAGLRERAEAPMPANFTLVGSAGEVRRVMLRGRWLG
jgi:N-acetylglucosamine-6-phosphate deacetylase